jgi:outer membrane biogenesis lipoprotein LolB
MNRFLCFIILSASVNLLLNACCSDTARNSDWLIDNSSCQSGITVSPDGKDLTLSNGLVSRVFRISPNQATVALHQLSTGQNYVRATRPEGMLVIDGVEYGILSRSRSGFRQKDTTGM